MKLSLQNSMLSPLLDRSDGLAGSRRGILLYTYLSSMITYLTTTTYFVGLMLEMGADAQYISVVTVLTTVCGFAQFFSPLLLERLKKRKRILIGMRALYHLFGVVVLGVVPLLPISRLSMLTAFLLAVIVANLANALSISGLSVWHIQNIPEDKRSDFFTLTSVGSTLINAISGFPAGMLVDSLKEGDVRLWGLSPAMLAFLLLRVAALAAAVCEMICLLSVKEHPYAEAGDKERLRGLGGVRLLLCPLGDRRYMKTILIYIGYCFAAGLIGKYFDVYLLQVAHISYTYISLSSIVALPVVLLSSPVWSRLFKRLSWQKVMPLSLTGTAVGYFFNTLITQNTHYFHIFCAVFYATFNVANTTVFAFLPYVHMPQADRTAYASFFAIGGSVASLMGNLAGMLFMNASEGLSYTLFGLPITNYQTLNLLQVVLFLLLALYSACVLGKGER